MEQAILTSSIPEAKLEAVKKALQQTFHTTTVESLILLAGGFSGALVYKIIISDKPYVLKLVRQIDALNDPVRQYACMNIAAEAGIAPYVYYSNAEDAVSITDFIQTTPLSEHFASPHERLPKLVKTIKSIHATPLFPKLVNYLEGIDMLIEQFKASKVLPESATESHFSYYSQIKNVYPRYDRDIVSSHNDLNPNNILFDGQRIWVIDWGAAFQNDRYVDLANVASSFVYNQMEEDIYLKAYFGDSLDESKRARFFLMQQVCHIFYAMGFLQFAAASRPKDINCDDSMDTPRLKDFHQQLRNGKVSISTYEGQLLYGKVRLNEALYNMKTPRFAESITKLE